MLRQFSERPLRIPRLLPFVPKPGDPRIYAFNDEREAIVRAVVHRATARHFATRPKTEAALADVAFHEIRRLEAQKDDEAAASLGTWRTLLRRIPRMSDSEAASELTRVAEAMTWDVAGNFDPRVYEFARKAMPKLLTGVMRPSELPSTLLSTENFALDALLRIEGAVEHLRAVEPKATLVYVPTHSSNLDSIVLGQALERSGLSPVMYGAGKNLFTNPIISFFMHNLGAYRVDRRIRASFYKDILKAYAGETVRRGYHSLFFPGGTRSRSNLIESRLKLGLAGAAVEAFAERRAAGDDRPILFVPTTINYELVLEGDTLIDDWLVEEGKSRYIIEDDEFSRVDRWVSFFRRLVDMRAAGVIRFGAPIDPFGNKVDLDARSIGPGGRVLDPGSYVLHRGVPTIDVARDAAYTRELGDTLAQVYKTESVIMVTQLVAHVLFRRLVRESGNIDLFKRLRLRGEVSMSRAELEAEVGRTRDVLRARVADGMTKMSAELDRETPAELVSRTFRVWSGYHKKTAVHEAEGVVTIDDPTLVLYYQNRLVPFAEALVTDEADRAAARWISNLGAKR